MAQNEVSLKHSLRPFDAICFRPELLEDDKNKNGGGGVLVRPATFLGNQVQLSLRGLTIGECPNTRGVLDREWRGWKPLAASQWETWRSCPPGGGHGQKSLPRDEEGWMDGYKVLMKIFLLRLRAGRIQERHALFDSLLRMISLCVPGLFGSGNDGTGKVWENWEGGIDGFI